jgi:hypothetical protein
VRRAGRQISSKAPSADIDGFSLHAAVRCGADDHQALGQLCRYIARLALAKERMQTSAAGQVVAEPNTPCARRHALQLSWASLAGHASSDARLLAKQEPCPGSLGQARVRDRALAELRR